MEAKEANPDVPDGTGFAQLYRKQTTMQSIMDKQSKQAWLCLVAVGEPIGILFMGLLSSSMMSDAEPLEAGVEPVI